MKKSKAKKTRLRVFFDIVGYSLFGLIFVLVCIVAVQSFSGGHPNLFGYCYYYIQTGSMDGDNVDSFPEKSIILSKMIDEEDCYDLVVGDIITFTPSEENLPSYITTKTHRIVEIDYENKMKLNEKIKKIENRIIDEKLKEDILNILLEGE